MQDWKMTDWKMPDFNAHDLFIYLFKPVTSNKTKQYKIE